MKKLMLLLVVFLTSCATNEKYAAYLDTYIGMDKASLIDAMGVPDSTYKLNAKTEYLTWKKNQSYIMPGTAYTTYNNSNNYTTTYSPTYIANQWCNTTFVIVDNKVTRWLTKGDWCVM